MPFEKARGPVRTPNRRTSHIRGRSGLAVRSNVWVKGACPVTEMGRHCSALYPPGVGVVVGADSTGVADGEATGELSGFGEGDGLAFAVLRFVLG